MILYHTYVDGYQINPPLTFSLFFFNHKKPTSQPFLLCLPDDQADLKLIVNLVLATFKKLTNNLYLPPFLVLKDSGI